MSFEHIGTWTSAREGCFLDSGSKCIVAFMVGDIAAWREAVYLNEEAAEELGLPNNKWFKVNLAKRTPYDPIEDVYAWGMIELPRPPVHEND